MASAIISFPVPLSPVMRTERLDVADLPMILKISCITLLFPTIDSTESSSTFPAISDCDGIWVSLFDSTRATKV